MNNKCVVLADSQVKGEESNCVILTIDFLKMIEALLILIIINSILMIIMIFIFIFLLLLAIVSLFNILLGLSLLDHFINLLLIVIHSSLIYSHHSYHNQQLLHFYLQFDFYLYLLFYLQFHFHLQYFFNLELKL